MERVDADIDDPRDRAADVAGTPEGDGDFETDNLPSTGETSTGGQVSISTTNEPREDLHGQAKHEGVREKVSALERIIDEVSTGKIQP